MHTVVWLCHKVPCALSKSVCIIQRFLTVLLRGTHLARLTQTLLQTSQHFFSETMQEVRILQ